VVNPRFFSQSLTNGFGDPTTPMQSPNNSGDEIAMLGWLDSSAQMTKTTWSSMGGNNKASRVSEQVVCVTETLSCNFPRGIAKLITRYWAALATPIPLPQHSTVKNQTKT
jgi:hypothetical protein